MARGMKVSGTSLDDLVDVGVITKGTIKGEHVTNVGGRAVNLNEMTKKLNKEMQKQNREKAFDKIIKRLGPALADRKDKDRPLWKQIQADLKKKGLYSEFRKYILDRQAAYKKRLEEKNLADEKAHKEWAAKGYPISNPEKLKQLGEGKAIGASAADSKNRGGLTKSGHKDYRGTGMFYGGMAKKANKK